MLPFTLEQLRELDDEQRAAAIASLAEAIAQRVGLSWDAIVARHRPSSRSSAFGLSRKRASQSWVISPG